MHVYTHMNIYMYIHIYMLHTCLISCLEFSHLRSCGTLHDAAETLVMENASQVLAGQLDVTSWLLMCLCVCACGGVCVCAWVGMIDVSTTTYAAAFFVCVC